VNRQRKPRPKYRSSRPSERRSPRRRDIVDVHSLVSTMPAQDPDDPESAPLTLERRLQRLTVPACPTCASSNTVVATRVEFFVYFRCEDCLAVWSAAKPNPMPAPRELFDPSSKGDESGEVR
jgi:hypothetical protein